MKKNNFKKIILAGSLLMSLGAITSCNTHDDEPITDLTRYTANDIRSYSDLFDVFWKTMDQRYNYFYEQKRRDGMEWDAIYEKYSPKFKALKTFGRLTDNDRQVDEDYQLARQYFSEIVDPIIDQHFYVQIGLPATKDGVQYNATFFGGMLTGVAIPTYNYTTKINYMKNRLTGSVFAPTNGSALGGFLASNPDIYYFTFSQFNLSSSFQINLNDKYLVPDEGNSLVLTEQKIDASAELNAIADPVEKKRVRDFTINVLNQWNQFPKSKEIENFHNEIAKFKTTEKITNEFLSATQTAYLNSLNLVAYSASATYNSVRNSQTTNYINWFIAQMGNHVNFGYRFSVFQTAAVNILNRYPFYSQFLNPLHNGDIKKIIIDLRSNGGGAVVDARFFTDRFITKNEIFAYQRSKEGNGRFNYTPWVPAKTTPHAFGIPKEIPIVILTDASSASMSEISTLMLKSQGNHVVSIGSNSAGATAGLGVSDDFNGGTRDVVAGRLTFYMPLLAMKDASGKVIEGIGIEPNIRVSPLTSQELTDMQRNPSTFVDRDINAAIEFLESK